MQEVTFVALDCETTGLAPESDNIIELGAVKFTLDRDLSSFDSLFKNPTNIPQFVERLTGIKNADLLDAPSFSTKREEFIEFCRDSVLVGHNLQFDLDFLVAAGVDLSQNLSFDTFELAALLLPRGGRLSLEQLSERFGIVHNEVHRALADSEATRDLFRILFALAKKIDGKIWQKIQHLQAGESAWVKRLAKLVLDAPTSSLQFPAGQSESKIESSETLNSELSKKLSELTENSALSFLEATVTSREIITSAQLLDQPVTVLVGSGLEAQQLAVDFGIPPLFASSDYFCNEKLEQFLSRQLSSLEAAFAAKLLLHQGKSAHEIILNRTESLLFGHVAADKNCQHSDCSYPRALEKADNSKITISNHASLSDLIEQGRLAVVAQALDLADNLKASESFIFDLSKLESLVPRCSNTITLWWGVLGLLFREATPQFGRLNLSEAQGLSNYSRAMNLGKNLLEDARSDLPVQIVRAFENLLNESEGFFRILRSSATGDISLSIEPREAQIPKPNKAIFIDSALDAGDSFEYIQKLFSADKTEATFMKMPSANGESTQFLLVDGLPTPTAPQFAEAAEKIILKILQELDGVTAVLLPSNREIGNLYERSAELPFPVFARKLPSDKKLLAEKKAACLLTIANRNLPKDVQNLVLLKLPFFVKENADWLTETLPATVLRFKRVWSNFRNMPKANKFVVLDSRLTGKNYGQNFLTAISEKPETWDL